jgi:hypothetical protein
MTRGLVHGLLRLALLGALPGACLPRGVVDPAAPMDGPPGADGGGPAMVTANRDASAAPSPAPSPPAPAPPGPPAPGPRPPAAADAAASPGDGPPPGPPVDSRPVVSVAVAGYQLMVSRRSADGGVAAAPYVISGIAWSPAKRGGGQPDVEAMTQASVDDFPLMRAANINTVKTYGPVERVVLDRMLSNGMLAIVTVFANGRDDYLGNVMALRDHPAVLMWMVGNEWNLNHIYGSCAGDACYTQINQIAAAIKKLDPNHPVATSFSPMGQLPSDSDLRRLDAVDVWGLNVYSQPGFFNRFLDWRLLNGRTGVKKPFFLSEYGADAYDERTGAPNEAAQAAALRQQTSEIRAQLSARNPALPCLGGTPFEWNDEWWKIGSAGAQDRGGFANPGVAPDSFANEEWWGMIDIDRKPRAAYAALAEQYAR